MTTLASAILENQAASLAQIEAALARQMLHGGDLATNLLELFANEAALSSGLSASFRALPPGELPRADDEALRLVSREMASRHRLYPLSLREGVLEIAVTERLPRALENELSRKIGLPLRLRFAPLPRIHQALARDYGLPLQARLAHLLEKLDAAPSEPLPQALEASRIEHSAEQATKAVAVLASKAPVRASRRLGPITPALAKEALEEAKTRDDVLSAFFDFAKQFFEYTALFGLQRNAAEGLSAHGPGALREKVQQLRIPLDAANVLAAARDRKLAGVIALREEDESLQEGLERRVEQALLLPIVLRDRTVAILYGDHGDDAVELSAVGDVLAIAPLVAQALERLILRKKQADKG